MQHMKTSVADTGLQVRVRPGNPDPEMGGGGLDVLLHLARAKLDPIDLGPVV